MDAAPTPPARPILRRRIRWRPSRLAGLGFCIIITIVGLAFLGQGAWAWWLVIGGGILCLVGWSDLTQTKHSLKRNYPVLANFRWLAELVRPELRQYLFEADEEAVPFSRNQRTLVYMRSKGEAGERAFGTLLDVYRHDYEFVGHSTCPAPLADPASSVHDWRAAMHPPYSASVLISRR